MRGLFQLTRSVKLLLLELCKALNLSLPRGIEELDTSTSTEQIEVCSLSTAESSTTRVSLTLFSFSCFVFKMEISGKSVSVASKYYNCFQTGYSQPEAEFSKSCSKINSKVTFVGEDQKKPHEIESTVSFSKLFRQKNVISLVINRTSFVLIVCGRAHGLSVV